MVTGAQQITLLEAAQRLGVHYMTAYRYVRTGALPARQVGARWMVKVSDVDAVRSPQRRGSPPRRGVGPARVRQQLMSRLVAGDEAGSWVTIQSALAGGTDPTSVYVELIAPVLRAVGDEWESGRLQVAGEHRASATATRIIGRLGPLFSRRGRPRGTVVIGVVAHDRHGLPAAMLSDVVRSAGFQVLDLGADTPPVSFVETAREASRLVAVMVCATIDGCEESVSSTVSALRSAGVEAPILLGGAAVKGVEHADALGGDAYTGLDARSAMAVLNEVAAMRRPAVRPVP